MVLTRGTDRIHESPALLSAMLKAAERSPSLYQPGPYWRAKTKVAVREIRRKGLDDFRGEHSAVGVSFADNLYTDVRTTLDAGRGLPVRLFLERVWPFSAVFDAQVALTRGYARDEVALLAARVSENPLTHELLSRYTVRDSLLGGCVATAVIDDDEVALHYLRTLQLLDYVRNVAPVDEFHSLFEIGGGFGALVHLMLDNLPRLRKIVYLDVVPNLYVGTCYLRTLFGSAVRDFAETGSLERIRFRDDDSLEILPIAPWQIERLDVRIDAFWNSNSFVEMPAAAVRNYAAKIMALPESDRTTIVLSSYGGGGEDTLSPTSLPTFFAGRSFVRESFWAIDRPSGHRSDAARDANWETQLFVSVPAPA
jgi:putative sugar O-methyltransferase